MGKSAKIRLELLAPAKNAEIAIAAIKHGADAVYMGAAKYGARASAGNSIEDIKAAVDFAHRYNARIYVTVNTILFDDELAEVERLINDLYLIGVDALIVQDMGILKMKLPPISLHASTQCDLRTPEKAEFLEKVGFSQLVMARELTLEEIKAIRSRVTVPLEAFVHGALCVSYSGRCGLSYACMKRSANRGECAQMCRLPYNLIDENGRILAKDKHLLSLKDMNQSDNLREMIEAGVSSFKIEGRLKDVDYVKNVVAYYSRELDKIVAENPEKYERGAVGNVKLNFEPQLDKVFNRSFTSYFLKKRRLANRESIASIYTPKSYGEYVGTALSTRTGTILKVTTTKPLSNGDGFSYFDATGEYTGFRANKINGDMMYLSQPLRMSKPTKLYRTFDKEFTDKLNGDSAKRSIWVDICLSYRGTHLALDITDERGNEISCCHWLEVPLELAQSSQTARQEGILRKLGNTIYTARNVDVTGVYFVPSSVLADLRRRAIALLDSAQVTNYKFEYRRKESRDHKYLCDKLTYVDNVANSLSLEFYKEHGVNEVTKAIESADYKFTGDEVLMHTRYCVLRELGYCRMDKFSQRLPEKIYLVNDKVKLLVETDCANCEMKLRLAK